MMKRTFFSYTQKSEFFLNFFFSARLGAFFFASSSARGVIKF